MRTQLFIAMLLVFACFTSYGQLTTSEIRGTIRDEKSEPLPEAKLVITHVPTGTVYQIISDLKGSFYLPQLKSGGPYSMQAQYASFKNYVVNDLYLVLGETKYIDIVMQPEVSELAEVEIVATSSGDNKKGTETNIKADQINKLPSMNRSLQDMTRLTPQSGANSYAGSNYRYNNLSIDGSANNDAFGFQEPASGAGGSTAAGSPGALSKTQPISLDAVGEIQVAISPYDVKLGNFTGGALNVVTKSGTNKWETSIYAFGRNHLTTGKSPDENRDKIENFYDGQSGFRVGGPLKKDKLFLFVNAETGRRSEPLLNAPGTSGSSFALSDIQALSDTLMSRYNYDPGTFGNKNLITYNYKFFTRLDWNINKNNQLAVRYNFVQGSNENLSRSSNILNYGSQGFTHNSITNNVVAELKTRFTSKLFNTLIVGASKIHDYRDVFGTIFPHVEITYNTGSTIFLGTYREAGVYQMYQNAYELTDNLTYYVNKHKLTFGTHNEIYQFNYHFVTPFTGRWAYRSIQDFYDDKPSRIRGTYNLTDDSYDYNYNRPSASFPVALTSFYVQDDYAVNRRLKLSYGLRLDGNLFLGNQHTTEDLRSKPQFEAYTEKIKNQFILSPRVGFNYDANANGTIKLRGGAGIFAGRAPFAWTAYSYVYNGNQFGNIDYRPSSGEVVPLITSDYGQLQNIQPGKREINVVDPNFKLPRVARFSLATDLKLPAGVNVTLEGIYTKTIYDALFQTLNLKDSTKTISGNGADDRPVYLGSGDAGRVDPNYSSVFLLTNTKQGYRYSLSAIVSKKFTNGPNATIAYNYGMSKDIMNGVRVSPQANWEWNQTTNPNKPELSYSNFDLRHRIVASLDFEKAWNNKNKSTISGVFVAQSGSPFTYVYNGDVNRDASSTNDLIYVPRDASDIKLVDKVDGNGNVLVSAAEQWNQLDAYISKDSYLSSRRGKTVERNGARTPWNAQLDIRLAHEFTFKGKKTDHKIQITADFINVLNVINYRWCRQYYVPNTTNAGYSLITVKSVSASTGAATFQFDNPKTDPWQVDQIASRLQAQLGIRYSF